MGANYVQLEETAAESTKVIDLQKRVEHKKQQMRDAFSSLQKKEGELSSMKRQYDLIQLGNQVAQD